MYKMYKSMHTVKYEKLPLSSTRELYGGTTRLFFYANGVHDSVSMNSVYTTFASGAAPEQRVHPNSGLFEFDREPIV